MTEQVFSGGYQCRRVRYEIFREELVSYACHCKECQKQTTSAFAISIPTQLSELNIVGDLKSYERPAHSGAVTSCYFCTVCGTRIYHKSSTSNGLITLKGGTLDRANDILPMAHLWTSRKHEWIELPAGVEIYERQPANLASWRNRLLGK